MSIFTGMSDLLKRKKSQPFVIKSDSQRKVWPILSADILLDTEKRQHTLAEIRALLNLPEQAFYQMFQIPLENFAEFVQNMPETEKSCYANIGGMLDHALERASLSLFLCRTYLLPKNSHTDTLPMIHEEEMLWIYAVFTAALLYDIGKIATTHVIALTQKTGETVKLWSPYEGPMNHEKASHYVFCFTEEHHDHMRWMITPLLARQILPAKDFNWLASDTGIFESWLALLSDEHRQVGSILTVVLLADAELLESYFTDKKILRHNMSAQKLSVLQKIAQKLEKDKKMLRELHEKNLAEKLEKLEKSEKNPDLAITPTTIEDAKKTNPSLFGFASIPLSIEDKQKKQQTLSGKEITGLYIDWLKNNIEQATLSVNKQEAYIQHSKEGVILDDRLLEKFITENQLNGVVNATQLKQAIIQNQIAKPIDYCHVLQIAQQTGQFNSAVLVQNPYLVFPYGSPPPLVFNTMIMPNKPSTDIPDTAPAPSIKLPVLNPLHHIFSKN